MDGKIHDAPEHKEYDSGKEFELKELGLEILRFTNEEVLNDTDKVVAIISASLQTTPKSPIGESGRFKFYVKFISSAFPL